MSRARDLAREVARFVRANLASAIASGVEWALVTGLVLGGVHYLHAAAAGAVTGAAIDFALKRWWAFDRERRAHLGHEGARYLAVSAGSLALNLAAAWALVDGLGLPEVPGVVAASLLVGAVWNYPLHRLYVFRCAAAAERAPGGAARAALRWAIAAAALAACAWLLARAVDPAALGRALAGADWRLVAAMTAGHFALFLTLKAWRWQLLLAPLRRLPLARLYAYCLAGCALTNLLPARAGQAARVLLLRRDGVPVAGAVAGLALEEVGNAAVLGLLCLPVPFLLPLPGGVGEALAVVGGGAVVALGLLAALAIAGRARPPGLLRRVADGLAVLGTARAAALAFALTVAMWLVDLGQIALAMVAAGVPPSYAGVALVLLFVNVTNAVPVTPGQLGLFEAAAAAACVLVGATPEQGVTVGVLYHLMQLVPETVAGLGVLGRGALAGERWSAAADRGGVP